ncbi:MAG TPA: hypothetical protein VMJ66_11845 [Geobacteraceae bacterium]|nr:hypothetical protein [Geobacteraceae bacterium]
MMAIGANLIAFYVGAIFFERAGFIGGLTVFLITALIGTITASVLEENLGIVYSRISNERGNDRAGRSVFPISLL